MSFEAHIGNVLRTCFFHLRQLKAIRNCIPLDTAKTLVNAFVVMMLDYCNSLLAGVPSCQFDRLQSVFNAAARLVCRFSWYDHITPLLRDKLHWLRCWEWITFKLCVMIMMYKSLHNKVLGYLQELCFPVNTNTRRSTLPSASNGQLIVPRTKIQKLVNVLFLWQDPVHWTAYRWLLDNCHLYHLSNDI